MTDDTQDRRPRTYWGGLPGWAWTAFGVVVLFIFAALAWGTLIDDADESAVPDTAGIVNGDAEVTAPGNIGEITSNPSRFAGQTVDVRGEVSAFVDGGFILEERGLVEGDDIRVSTQEAIPFQADEEIRVTGIVEVVDEETFDELGSGFFDDLALTDVEGDVVIRAQSLREAS